MNTAQQKFQTGELITWTTLEGQTWTRRPVAFERYTVGGRAIVTFGRTGDGTAPRRYDVPVSELSRTGEAANQPPIYHQDFIRPPAAPVPLSEQQLAARTTAARAALVEAHEDTRRAGDVIRSTGELVQRAQAEVAAATAALRSIDADQKTQERRFEAAIRRGETPPAIEPGEDRAAIDRRVASSTAALAKFAGEHQLAQSRLNAASAGIRAAATALLTVMLEKDIAALREMEQHALQCRADLIKITQWAGASGTALKLTEFASTVLSLPLDADSVRFLPTAAVGPWQALLERLLVDPLAELIEPVTVASEAA